MFTQLGLSNLWNNLKTSKFFVSQDIQIICDSYHERCMKIYIHSEGRYAHFSSKRTPGRTNSPFELWVRTTDWQPAQRFYNEIEESFLDVREERIMKQSKWFLPQLPERSFLKRAEKFFF